MYEREKRFLNLYFPVKYTISDDIPLNMAEMVYTNIF